MHTQLPGWAHGVLPPACDHHILALASQGRHANALGLQPHCIRVHLAAHMDTLVHHCCDALTMCTGCQLLRKTGRFWRDPAIGSSCWPASPSRCSWSSQHVWRCPMTFRCSFSSWAMDLLTKVIVELIHAGLKKLLTQAQPEEIFSM